MEEGENWLANLPDDERQELVEKLLWLRYRSIQARIWQDTIDRARYIVSSTRSDLPTNDKAVCKAYIALEMYRLYTALEAVVVDAREVEYLTCFRGAELTEE